MSEAVITSVVGRRVWDSRGRPTVEADVTVSSGAVGRAIAPAGASRGAAEAVELRDGGTAFDGMGVERAVDNVNTVIAEVLRGRPIVDQTGLDAALCGLDDTPDKSRLGGNAMIAVSMATIQAAAADQGVALWEYVSAGSPVSMPLPQIQIFGGGAHAARRVDVQDFMIQAVGAASFDEALAMTASVYSAAGRRLADQGSLMGVADEGGYWPAFDSNEEVIQELVAAIEEAGLVPGSDIGIALDVAASEFGSDGIYRLARDDRSLSTGDMVDLIENWLDRYPITSIEDPLDEDDLEGWCELQSRVGDSVQIVGDDLLVTNAGRVEAAAKSGACNALLVKPNQAGTVTETRAAFDAARAADFATIVSARSGESEDVTIVHLATGWNAGQLKVGSFARSERMAKWNEGIRIEEQLGSRARFAGRSALAGTSA